MKRAGLCVAVLVLVTVSPVRGQVSFALGVGYGGLTGGDLRGTEPGVTVGGGIYFPFVDSLEGGLLFDRSVYGGRGIEGDTRQLDFLAGLWYPVLSAPVRLLLGGKMGLSRQAFTVAGEPTTTEGFVLGPSVAVQVALGGVAVELAAEARYHTYEQIHIFARSEYGTDGDGLGYVLRAGLVLPLGG